MAPSKNKILVLMLGIALHVAAIAIAQQPEPPAADVPGDAPLDLGEFPGMLVDDVVVPVPSEIFLMMGKLGETAFGGELVARKNLVFRDRSRLALAFGVAVADGFIAVQAQDKEGIEEAGRSVLKLAEALGLKSRVLQHTQAIIMAADQGRWADVRHELDRTQKTVRDTMQEMRDGELANCVSIGGWIRGTEVMTSLISKAYHADQAELLNQPALAKHFSKLIGTMDKDVQAVEQVKAADACLQRIAELMGDGDGESVIGSDAVNDILAASKKFVDAVFAITSATATATPNGRQAQP